ncbi:MAG TPA: polymer-forming cytoskeletal protein, partial [Ramlibacter sp.]|nr:polymer-forming cytoskeletal protein [Ramlibacter sp.]
IINGTVKGPIVAREHLELQARARIEGEVQYAILEMQHGATISGQLRPLAGAAASSGHKPVIRLSAKTA